MSTYFVQPWYRLLVCSWGIAAALICISKPVRAQTTDILAPAWADQIQSRSLPMAAEINGVAAGRAIYLTGATSGALAGQTNLGGQDVFLMKLGPDGSIQWATQFGTDADDRGVAVVRLTDGRILVAGTTEGRFPASASAGGADLFAALFTAEGNRLWLRQFGTAAADQTMAAAALPANGALIAGTTAGRLGATDNQGGTDAFVLALDHTGATLWTKQLGTPQDDEAHGVAVTATGGFALAGRSRGAWQGIPSAGDFDGFVSVYDAQRSPLWTARFGAAAADVATDVAVTGSGTVAVSGITTPVDGTVGRTEGVVYAYDDAGTMLWQQTIATPGDYERVALHAVTATSRGDLIVGGSATASLTGEPHVGGQDALLHSLSAEGEIRWMRMVGTPDDDRLLDIATTEDDELVTGGINGAYRWGMEEIGLGDARRWSAAGVQAWQQLITGTRPGYELAHDVAVAADGTTYVVGHTNGILGESYPDSADLPSRATERAAFIRRYDGQGEILWTRQDNNATAGEYCAVHVDSAGNAMVYALFDGAETVERIDPEGNRLWSYRLESEQSTIPPCATDLAADDSLLAGGLVYEEDGFTGRSILNKVTSSGTLAWSREVPIPGYVFLEALTILSDGRIAVVGNQYPSGMESNWFLAVLSADAAALERIVTFPVRPGRTPRAVVEYTDNAVVVVGTQAIPDGSIYHADTFVSVHDSVGNQLSFTVLDMADYERARQAVVDRSGAVWVAGSAGPLGASGSTLPVQDGFLLKLRPLSAVTVHQRFDTGGDDQILGIAAHPDGRLQIGGYTSGTLVPGAPAGKGDAFTMRLVPAYLVRLPIVQDTGD